MAFEEFIREVGNSKNPKVYFTRKITPDSLVYIYHALGVTLDQNTMVKISTGEDGNPNYLKPELIYKLVREVDGTICDANTAYEGKRQNTTDHIETAKKHGFYKYFRVDILDSDKIKFMFSESVPNRADIIDRVTELIQLIRSPIEKIKIVIQSKDEYYKGHPDDTHIFGTYDDKDDTVYLIRHTDIPEEIEWAHLAMHEISHAVVHHRNPNLDHEISEGICISWAFNQYEELVALGKRTGDPKYYEDYTENVMRMRNARKVLGYNVYEWIASGAYTFREDANGNTQLVKVGDGVKTYGPINVNGDFKMEINGKHLDFSYIGSHFFNYENYLILSHFKGHPMAGYGGALKNIAIGMSSSRGKCLIHSSGNSETSIEGDHHDFLMSMAEAAKAYIDAMKDIGNVVYINVLNNISVDCDCVADPEPVSMQDIGIVASLDPVAVDQAAYDLLKKAPDSAKVLERIDEQTGLETIRYAEELGIGSRKYQFIDLDKSAPATEATTEAKEEKSKLKLSSFKMIEASPDYINAHKKEYTFLKNTTLLPKDSKTYVWENDEHKIVAVLIVSTEMDHKNYLTYMIVINEYRGRGLSKQLIDYAVKKLHVVGTVVPEKNERAIRIFTSYGFKPESKMKNKQFMTLKK